MSRTRILATLAIAACAAFAGAQSWSDAYQRGLEALRAKNYESARTAFLEAATIRTEDQASPTTLPGPVAEAQTWRAGAAYSPNFAAAYCGYHHAIKASSASAKRDLLAKVIVEFGTLLSKNQTSNEAYYFLELAQRALGDVEGAEATRKRFKDVGASDWRIDSAIVNQEEYVALAAAQTATSPTQPAIRIETVQAGEEPPPVRPNPTPSRPIDTPPSLPPVSLDNPTPVVSPVPTKFAFLIGNSQNRLPGAALPFAGNDAALVRSALIAYAGYPKENVDIVLDATADQMSAAAKAFAEKVTDGATVFLFFAGAGASIDGKDFYAGVDTEFPTDSSSMIGKDEIYRLLMAKGARIFAFHEAHRPVTAGGHFGMDVPMVGAIAQLQATVPGQQVYGTMVEGRLVGVYAQAIVAVLADFKSNSVPITDFAWQVFYNVRRGNTGQSGGGSQQTPTLPVVVNMASDARF